MLGSHTEIQIELSKTIWIILDLAKVVKNPNLQDVNVKLDNVCLAK